MSHIGNESEMRDVACFESQGSLCFKRHGYAVVMHGLQLYLQNSDQLIRKNTF